MDIAAGDLNHRYNIKTGDEIQDLATEFNKMTIALQDSHATLEQKVAQRTSEVSALYSVTDDPDELANYACRCGATSCRGTMLDPVPLDRKKKKRSAGKRRRSGGGGRARRK